MGVNHLPSVRPFSEAQRLDTIEPVLPAFVLDSQNGRRRYNCEIVATDDVLAYELPVSRLQHW